MKTARLWLVSVALCVILFAGCTMIAPREAGYRSGSRNSPWVKESKREKGSGSWFGSWFRAAEPEPPQSVSEFMELEPIRP